MNRRHSGADGFDRMRYEKLKHEFTRVFGDLEPRGSEHLKNIIGNLAQICADGGRGAKS